jgi:segregation and condensation protein B
VTTEPESNSPSEDSDVIDITDGARAAVLTAQPVTDEIVPANGDDAAMATDADEPAEPAEADEVTDPPELGAPSLAAALEALLLLSEEPLTPIALAELVGRPVHDVEQQLHDLAAQYRDQQRGFELRNTDSGWRFYTAAECRELVTRFVTDGRQAKLSQAALETLAIVAYRQPVTRSQVGAVRGVNPDGVLKTLVARGLITESVTEGMAAEFATTPYFLDRMGMASLAELPPIADHLPNLDSLDELLD